MQKYDKIYIPVNQMANKGVYLIATERTTTSGGNMICLPLRAKEWLEEHKDKICMTVEEAKELFQAGMERFRWEECGTSWEQNSPSPDFGTYLQSKGINIEG